jgi:hypothetical protein
MKKQPQTHPLAEFLKSLIPLSLDVEQEGYLRGKPVDLEKQIEKKRNDRARWPRKDQGR